MGIITNIAQIVRRRTVINEFIKPTKNPYAYQKRFLFNTIKKNKNTVFGLEHNFSKIKTIEDFQRNVPIRKYKDFKRYIDEMKIKGSQNVLTKEPFTMFGVSSGTTGTPKFIPVTRSFIEQYRRDWDIWVYFAYKDHPKMFDGKILVMVGAEKEGQTKIGINYGSISGVIQNTQKKIIQHFYCLPNSVYKIKNYEAKYYTILRIALEQNISTIVTPNPSMILILCKKINEYKNEIISDIETGKLSKDYTVEENIREELEFKPNPKRAFELMKIDKTHKGLYPKHIWTKLSLIGCWKEGTLPIYLTQFPKYFGNTPVRDIGLISTEGHASIPVTDEAKGGVLTVNSSFFEFIDIKDIKKRIPEVYTLMELERDKDYFLIMTNPNGLYRYFTNDIVKVVGYYNKTPIIEFLHKGEHVSSITGEKITEWQVVTAMRFAAHRLDVPVHSFTVYPKFGRLPKYNILLELHGKCDEKKLGQLINYFDEELKYLNVEYKGKRDSQRLGRPVIQIVQKGSYSSIHKSKTEAGAHDAQIKIPSLSTDQKFGDDFEVVKVIR
ncbi:MAG: GH3 auxin-responsive promoter family protein [Nanoarchaeota archaeon]